MNYYNEKILNPMYSNSLGLWEVTTEGDCEGRTTRDLGTYYGNFDEVAFHVADKVMYKLTLTKIEPTNEFTPKADNVLIQFNMNSGMYHMTPEQTEPIWNSLLKDRPANVKDNRYGSQIVLELEQNMNNKRIRQAALNKLTAEERRLLNLPIEV